MNELENTYLFKKGIIDSFVTLSVALVNYLI